MRPFFAILLSLSIFACESAKKEIPGEKEVVFTEYSSLPFTIYETNGECATDTSRNCTMVNVEYPLVSDSIRATAAENINKELARQAANNLQFDTIPYPSVRNLVADFMQSYRELQEDFPEAFGWRLNITGQILRNDPIYVVVIMNSESYTGGAHGSRHVQYTNFSALTGDVLELEDIVKESEWEELNRRALTSFKTSKGLGPDDNPGESGYAFPSEKYFNPDNFAFVNDSLIFYFNPYEIAPYSDGVTRYSVSIQGLN